ncbi:hypothetical protein EV122DRAFT_283300 [Schizophyllum commune]
MPIPPPPTVRYGKCARCTCRQRGRVRRRPWKEGVKKEEGGMGWGGVGVERRGEEEKRKGEARREHGDETPGGRSQGSARAGDGMLSVRQYARALALTLALALILALATFSRASSAT